MDEMPGHYNLPPTFFQVLLTVCQFSFIHLGEESTVRVKWLAQEHNTWLALKPGLLYAEFNMLIIRPPLLYLLLHVPQSSFLMALFSYLY